MIENIKRPQRSDMELLAMALTWLKDTYTPLSAEEKVRLEDMAEGYMLAHDQFELNVIEHIFNETFKKKGEK